ncbi:DNA-binding transcriptional LysR family regulator [Paraburkholderia sp. BL23I1N1]|uniref:LysR family transcriptional regulator n=1 Tax=Paraburkholderia sp. BL23I1N1 TaxID=1938802 RepID=UPI000E751DF5|nr:LysR family transcriptional regulator [Paraburkholderia sp. BL23I1N1]RKE36355.1 DNA-binding transcriptional LysR family regulator [Paraburkholderia sp. BL23I1N1]
MNILRNMKIFVRVAETESFTTAAHQLGLNTGQASRAVAELETHLRTRLFNRTTRRVVLTDAGGRYVQRCREILALVDVSEAEAGAAKTSPSGVLRIHAPSSFGEIFVVPALAQYLESNPFVRGELTLSQSVPDLLEDGFDVSLRVTDTQLPDSALVSMKICQMPNVLCASPRYLERRGLPGQISDLRRHACAQLVTPYSSSSLWKLAGPEQGNEIGLPPANLRVNSAGALAVALTEGAGIGSLPLITALPLLRSGALVRVLPEYTLPSVTIYAVYASREYLDAKIRTWVAFLRDYVAQAISADYAEAGLSDALCQATS